MDSWGIGASFRLVALLQAESSEFQRRFYVWQVVAAIGFALAILFADFEEERVH